MQARVLYYNGNLQGKSTFLTENLATQFNLSNAVSIEISTIEQEGSEQLILIIVK